MAWWPASRHGKGSRWSPGCRCPALPGAEPPEPGRGGDARGGRRHRADEPVHRLERGAARSRRRWACATSRCRACAWRPSATTVRSRSTSTRSASDAEQVGAAWGEATTFRLTTPGGTDLRGSVQGRPGRVLHGLAREDGDYMAPPDIEAGTAPVETSSEGTVVVDADLLFMGEGPLPSPVVLRVRRRASSSRSRARRRAGSTRCSRAAPTIG